MTHKLPENGIWAGGPYTPPHTLEEVYGQLRFTAEHLDFDLKTAISPKRLCISIANPNDDDASIGSLELCESGEKVAIYAHRSEDLTHAYKGRVVSVKWVKAFMAAWFKGAEDLRKAAQASREDQAFRESPAFREAQERREDPVDKFVRYYTGPR
jgi:hypothetical protein